MRRIQEAEIWLQLNRSKTFKRYKSRAVCITEHLLPVHTQSTQVEDRDPDRSFLKKREQFTETQPEEAVGERKVTRQELKQTHTRVSIISVSV